MARRIYAIGDVHGRLDLLVLAARAINRHVGDNVGAVIMLGDYVDRGPDSKGVIEFLMRAEKEGALTCLRGNHEQIMLDALELEDPTSDMMWMGNGGFQTLASYDGKVSPEHVEWLKALPFLTADDHRIYVHAGVMPGVPADAQDEHTLIWIRQRFLRASADELPSHIVHGHTPQWEGKPDPSKPELLPHRTNLDTGAYATGVLSVGVFDPETPGGPLEVLAITLPADAEPVHA